MCSNECAELKDVHHLDRRQMRLISDPIRQRILQALCKREMSATELKRLLDDAPSNLHYHVDRLAEAGLIHLVRTEPRRGATEKYYRAVARQYTMAPALLAQVPDDRVLDEEMLAVTRGLLEEAYASLARGLAAGLVGDGEGSEVPVITGSRLRTSRRRALELRGALVDWIRACAEAHDPDGDVEFACLSLMLPVDLGDAAATREGAGEAASGEAAAPPAFADGGDAAGGAES